MYLRLFGTPAPLGMTRIKSYKPIESDLDFLGLVPTQSQGFWFVDPEFECDPIPVDLLTMNVEMIRATCQFVVDLKGHKPFVFRPGEERTWYELFDKINYRIRIHLGRIYLVGLRNRFVV
jgi:hypothetical protein